ncbi:MAG: arginine--tRNA ligase [Oscillospiraceae bacterium]|nr:arginine--tRNA ligase [Oscillospiraceae bacterium]MCL2278454.1 arginine--tRNA ligase [Oscillospiraceae bacterium]
MNLITAAKNQIDELINNAFEKVRTSGSLPEGALSDTSEKLSGSVEIPRDTSHGDYAATHAMAAAKKLKIPPRDIAKLLTDNIELSDSYFKSISIAGPGFINFVLADSWYNEVLHLVESMNDNYGRTNIGDGRRVMVEFVSANPTGPMTIGNARGGALGDILASVLERAGYDVWREFLMNDTGNQVDLFGKSIDARYMQLCVGEENYVFPDDGYHGDDIKNLAQEIFEKEGDKLSNLPLEERTQKFVEFGLPRNISKMKEHLKRYKIHFDEWFSEKKMHDSGYVASTVDILDKAGLLFEKDGALWLKNTELGGEKDEVLKKSNGFYTYYAADIAYHRNKLERGFDKAIDIWGADHHGHARRLIATMTSPVMCEALGLDGSKLHFVLMQMVRIVRDGETIKVSKRTGKALTLNDLMDEISVDACRFFFNARPDSHLEFDIALAVRQDSENPVYYVQYAHARINSLIKNLESEGHSLPKFADIDPDLLCTEPERELIKQISMLPEEIAIAARDYDPSRINRYVIELAARFHKFYSSCRIKGEETALLSARLKLAALTKQVIKNSLEILKVTAPDKM